MTKLRKENSVADARAVMDIAICPRSARHGQRDQKAKPAHNQ